MTMQTSDQDKNTRVSATAPVVNNGEGCQPARLSSAGEQAIAEAVSQFYLAAGRQNKLQALRGYRLRCQKTKIKPVSGLRFLRRIRDVPPLLQPRGSHFLALAQIDSATLDFSLVGGASS